MMSTSDREFSIPPELANSLLETELQFDTSPSAELIHSLVDIYSSAIEHYEQKDNQKYQDIKARMQQMLSRTDISKIIRLHNTPNKQGTTQSRQVRSVTPARKSRDLIKFRLSKQVEEALGNSSIQFQRKLREIVEKHSLSVQCLAVTAKNDCLLQEESMESKLSVRKRRNLSQPMDLDLNEQEERTPTKGQSIYEEQLEEIMEKFYTEKAEKLTAVKVKFEGQITQLTNNAETRELEANQLKAAMEAEIKEISAELDCQRRAELSVLKEMTLQ